MIDNFFYILYRDPINNFLCVKFRNEEKEFSFQLPERAFDNEEELVRHVFKFMKSQLNDGKIHIANMSILPEYQELFNEVLNDPNVDEHNNIIDQIINNLGPIENANDHIEDLF